ncbi:hypothetical protein ACFL6F_03595, partial [Planctomycetota bacterium]
MPVSDYEQLIYSPVTYDMKEFENLSEMAKDAGFTHIDISKLMELTDFQGFDKESPWTNWSLIGPSIFKFVLPPGMEDAFPKDFVKRQMDFMKQKHDIIDKLGLKGYFWGIEPHWLNEKVYEKHPQWRGARCDNSLRSTGMFFSPNTDNEEVQECYRSAVETMLTECPLLDTIGFLPNDSGSGMPWSEKLYVNINGPSDTLNKPMGKRVRDFMRAMRQGGLDAGVDVTIRVIIDNRFYQQEKEDILQYLEPGFGIMGKAPNDPEGEYSLLRMGNWSDDSLISQMPSPENVTRFAAAVKTTPVKRFFTGGDSEQFFKAFKTAMAEPAAENTRQTVELMGKIADNVYAEDVRDELVDAWTHIDRANIRKQSSLAPLFSAVMLRWLTRPLVPFQEELTEDERAYWEPYIYQSQESQPETYLDYLNVTGKPMFTTWNESSHVCCGIDTVVGEYYGAAAKLASACEKTQDDGARALIQADLYRVKAAICLALNARHTLQMGTLIHERDKDREEEFTSKDIGKVDMSEPHMPKGSTGSISLFYMYRTMRWELDNIYELIGLIEKSEVPLFTVVPRTELATALQLEPDLLENLKKKVKIMLKYWRTAERGYAMSTKGG